MFFLINKDIWMSSFDVIRSLRKKFGIKKMGHIGTLDPLASGLMLIATEKSTKMISFLNSDKKTYIFTVRFDGKSESLDAGEEIIPVDISQKLNHNNEQIIEFLLSQKTQIPPKFSALHINWKRAYDLARSGIDFSIPERKIKVFDVEIINSSHLDITIRMTISSGGYIRSFAPILWKFFGVDGGYISFLHREKLHFSDTIFTDKDSKTLENITISDSLSLKDLFPSAHHFYLQNSHYEKDIREGKSLNTSDLISQISSEISLKNLHEGDAIFLYFENYTSFWQIKNNQYKIIKNDI